MIKLSAYLTFAILSHDTRIHRKTQPLDGVVVAHRAVSESRTNIVQYKEFKGRAFHIIFITMAEEKKNGNGKMGGGMTCGCGCGGHGHSWMFFLLRTLLTIIILMVVFWFGVVAGRLGDIRSYVRNGYASPAYGGAGGAMPMMRINGATSTPTSATGGVENY